MKTEALMSKSIAACRPEDSLATAAQIMWDRDVGFLPVVNGEGRVVGTVTDRDIAMGGFFNNLPLREIPVARVMCSEVVTCRPDDEASAAERSIRDEQVRRIPVVDRNGKLQGVVTLGDLSRAAKNPQLRDGLGALDLLATLNAVCTPTERAAQPERSRQRSRPEMRS